MTDGDGATPNKKIAAMSVLNNITYGIITQGSAIVHLSRTLICFVRIIFFFAVCLIICILLLITLNNNLSFLQEFTRKDKTLMYHFPDE